MSKETVMENLLGKVPEEFVIVSEPAIEMAPLVDKTEVENLFAFADYEEPVEEIGADAETPVEEDEFDKLLSSIVRIDNKVIDKIKFKKYLEDQEKDEKMVVLKNILDEDIDPNLPSYLQITYWKFLYKDIFLCDIGSPLEDILFGVPVQKFFYRALKYKDYHKFVSTVGPIKQHTDEYFKMLLSSCVLFPKIQEDEVDNIDAGITDLLIGMILKNSKMDTDYDIKRI